MRAGTAQPDVTSILEGATALRSTKGIPGMIAFGLETPGKSEEGIATGRGEASGRSAGQEGTEVRKWYSLIDKVYCPGQPSQDARCQESLTGARPCQRSARIRADAQITRT